MICRMVNVSLEHGYFADDWKRAVVHPLLKKPGLQLISKNFRPVSNLQFTSKLTEKAVAVQLQELMLVNGLFPELQSAYRQHHSTQGEERPPNADGQRSSYTAGAPRLKLCIRHRRTCDPSGTIEVNNWIAGGSTFMV